MITNTRGHAFVADKRDALCGHDSAHTVQHDCQMQSIRQTDQRKDTGMAVEGQEVKVRHYILAIVLAIFIGLCAVVGEALVPNDLPPQDILGWLVFLAAVTLFTVTFVITVIIAGFLDKIAASIPRRPLRQLWRERLPRITLAVISFAAVALVVWIFADPGKLIKDQQVGGLDLANYCRTYGYTANDDDACSRGIDGNQACDWQYGNAEQHIMVTKSGPYSGVCQNSRKKPVGGIKDMRGFCRSQFKSSTDVNAIVNSQQKWICQVKLDLNLACSWQYQKRDIEARKDGGLWYCYR